ncbi:sorting nexin [Anaeramoeba flamelloides]|uniref:Sorting nexin n=1 Tax=Anaeramoeba flamelloides TaxID=1746091 RepID=A0AAV8AFC1_9EUKA|nr:sorting nexin [Anaeramoeba flamelloides]
MEEKKKKEREEKERKEREEKEKQEREEKEKKEQEEKEKRKQETKKKETLQKKPKFNNAPMKPLPKIKKKTKNSVQAEKTKQDKPPKKPLPKVGKNKFIKPQNKPLSKKKDDQTKNMNQKKTKFPTAIKTQNTKQPSWVVKRKTQLKDEPPNKPLPKIEKQTTSNVQTEKKKMDWPPKKPLPKVGEDVIKQPPNKSLPKLPPTNENNNQKEKVTEEKNQNKLIKPPKKPLPKVGEDVLKQPPNKSLPKLPPTNDSNNQKEQKKSEKILPSKIKTNKKTEVENKKQANKNTETRKEGGRGRGSGRGRGRGRGRGGGGGRGGGRGRGRGFVYGGYQKQFQQRNVTAELNRLLGKNIPKDDDNTSDPENDQKKDEDIPVPKFQSNRENNEIKENENSSESKSGSGSESKSKSSNESSSESEKIVKKKKKKKTKKDNKIGRLGLNIKKIKVNKFNINKVKMKRKKKPKTKVDQNALGLDQMNKSQEVVLKKQMENTKRLPSQRRARGRNGRRPPTRRKPQLQKALDIKIEINPNGNENKNEDENDNSNENENENENENKKKKRKRKKKKGGRKRAFTVKGATSMVKNSRRKRKKKKGLDENKSGNLEEEKQKYRESQPNNKENDENNGPIYDIHFYTPQEIANGRKNETIYSIDFRFTKTKALNNIERNISDFLALRTLILKELPQYIIPIVPNKIKIGKKIKIDLNEQKKFLLKKFLVTISNHPVICHSRSYSQFFELANTTETEAPFADLKLETLPQEGVDGLNKSIKNFLKRDIEINPEFLEKKKNELSSFIKSTEKLSQTIQSLINLKYDHGELYSSFPKMMQQVIFCINETESNSELWLSFIESIDGISKIFIEKSINEYSKISSPFVEFLRQSYAMKDAFSYYSRVLNKMNKSIKDYENKKSKFEKLHQLKNPKEEKAKELMDSSNEFMQICKSDYKKSAKILSLELLRFNNFSILDYKKILLAYAKSQFNFQKSLLIIFQNFVDQNQKFLEQQNNEFDGKKAKKVNKNIKKTDLFQEELSKKIPKIKKKKNHESEN